MFIDDCFIKFQGFQPSEFTRSYLNDKMSSIHEEAPYGSILQANFMRKNHSFKGVITIYSSTGKFFAVASGNKLKEVTHRLIGQIRKQIGRWKSQRFQRESLKNTTFNDNNFNTEGAYDPNRVAP